MLYLTDLSFSSLVHWLIFFAVKPQGQKIDTVCGTVSYMVMRLHAKVKLMSSLHFTNTCPLVIVFKQALQYSYFLLVLPVIVVTVHFSYIYSFLAVMRPTANS